MSSKKQIVLGQAVRIGSLTSVTQEIVDIAELRRSKYVCFTTAYMLVKAQRDASIRSAYAASEMILPDGVPVAWCLQVLGHPEADCISGPRLTPMLLHEAARRGISVGFYGGRPQTVRDMIANLKRDLPALKIVYVYSPPFRPLNGEEKREVQSEMNGAGTQMLFVGLGSPKQDLWMEENAPSLPCVTLGIGAAFEFLSGEKYLPPVWIQRLGLTWFIRLCQEPRRLLRRNLYSPVFIVLFLQQYLWGARFHTAPVAKTALGESDE